MRIIIRHRPGREAFVAYDLEISVGHGAIPKVNVSRHAIKADCAKSPAIKLQFAVAFPGCGVATWSADCQLDGRSVRPVPFLNELAHIGRGERAEGVRLDRAGQIKPEVLRSIQELRGELSGLMPYMNVSDHRPRPIPGELRVSTEERDATIGKAFEIGATDCLPLRLPFADIGPARNIQPGRREKNQVGDGAGKSKTGEQPAYIQCALRLKFQVAGRSSPNGVPRKSTQIVQPFALCDT